SRSISFSSERRRPVCRQWRSPTMETFMGHWSSISEQLQKRFNRLSALKRTSQKGIEGTDLLNFRPTILDSSHLVKKGYATSSASLRSPTSRAITTSREWIVRSYENIIRGSLPFRDA